jgi:hypothetical protein
MINKFLLFLILGIGNAVMLLTKTIGNVEGITIAILINILYQLMKYRQKEKA